MSDDAKITDRPLPFEVKTGLLQLMGIAMGTPKDVGDVHFEYAAAWEKVDVRVYPGGYKSGATAWCAVEFYLDHDPLSVVLGKIADAITKVNAALADGRKIKVQRLRDEAAELLRKAAEVEGEISK